MRRVAWLAVLFASLPALPAAARAQAPIPVGPDAPAVANPPPLLTISSDKGTISLAMFAPPGSVVTFSEVADGVATPIRDVTVDPAPSPLPTAPLLYAIPWRCDRLVRTFTAVAVAPDGGRTTASAATKTPSCGGRLEVAVPATLPRGAVLPVTLTDRFALGGFDATVCAGKQGAKARCRVVPLVGGAPTVTHFRVGSDAVWTVRVSQPDGKVERVLTVGRAKRPANAAGLPSLLVTGDSLIQGVDAFVADRLQTAFDVTTDSRPGSGLANPAFVNWPVLARSQVKRLKPAVTVISLGINDGTPLDGTPCCGADWAVKYTAKVRALMESYSRGTRGRVIWLIAPTPRAAGFQTIAAGVAASIRAAAAKEPQVTLVSLDDLLTPGHVYRDKLRLGGKLVQVRAADGVHLSVAGERYVAGIVVDVLRGFRATG